MVGLWFPGFLIFLYGLEMGLSEGNINFVKFGSSGPIITSSSTPSTTSVATVPTASSPDEPCLIGPECQTTLMQISVITAPPKTTTTTPPAKPKVTLLHVLEW
jgi:hypothetical protein